MSANFNSWSRTLARVSSNSWSPMMERNQVDRTNLNNRPRSEIDVKPVEVPPVERVITHLFAKLTLIALAPFTAMAQAGQIRIEQVTVVSPERTEPLENAT